MDWHTLDGPSGLGQLGGSSPLPWRGALATAAPPAGWDPIADGGEVALIKARWGQGGTRSRTGRRRRRKEAILLITSPARGQEEHTSCKVMFSSNHVSHHTYIRSYTQDVTALAYRRVVRA